MKLLIKNNRLVVALLFLGAAFFAAFLPLQSFAQQTAGTPQIAPTPPAAKDFGYMDCLESPATCAIYAVSYIALTLTTYLIEWGGGLIQFMLVLNQTLFLTPALQVGFSVTLALANLGFVLAIIVIAIATIFRSQTYGIKQILWKLVAAAVLVNFSLVITGNIFNFSESLTKYFITQASPPGTGNAGFVVALMSAIKPQVLYQTETPAEVQQSWGNWLTSAATNPWVDCALFSGGSLALIATGVGAPLAGGTLATAAQACAIGFGASGAAKIGQALAGDSSNLAQFIRDNGGMILGVLIGLAIALTFFALAAMLGVRYLYLIFLIILMPFAWLAWIFPNLRSHWTKWWSEFFKWTFFGPLILFFIYLAILTIQIPSQTTATNTGTGGTAALNNTNQLAQAANQTASNQTAQGGSQNLSYIDAVTKNITHVPLAYNPLVQAAGNINHGPEWVADILKMAVALAFSIGGLFAANSLSITGASVAINGAKSAGKAVTGAVGGWAGRRATRAATAPLRTGWGRTAASALQRMPGGIFAAPLRYLGRGAEAIAVKGGEKQVEAAKKDISGKTSDQLANNMSTFAAPQRMAALQELISRDDLNKVKNLQKYMDEAEFKRYGQGKLIKDSRNAQMSTGEMREWAQKLAKNPGDAATAQALKKATDEFISKLRSGDLSIAHLNDIFSGKDALGLDKQTMKTLSSFIATAMVQKQTPLISSMLSKMSFESRGNWTEIYEKEISPQVGKETNDKIRKIIANYELGIAAVETPAPAAPTATPIPPAGGTPHA